MLMQIKQVKAYINTAYFTPWEYDTENDMHPMQIPSNSNGRPIKQLRKAKQLSFINKEIDNDKTIEEQAKKTLLYLETDHKFKKVEQLKQYIDNKNRPSKFDSIFPLGLKELKLPSINKKNQQMEYRSSLILGTEGERRASEEAEIFKKYGDHKKMMQRDGRVERSVSFGSGISKNIEALDEIRRKYDTIDAYRNKYDKIEDVKHLKLKGKKFSLDANTINIRRNQSSNDFDYLPTQPNITPHYILFGHNKEDILKKVLQQINHKIK